MTLVTYNVNKDTIKVRIWGLYFVNLLKGLIILAFNLCFFNWYLYNILYCDTNLSVKQALLAQYAPLNDQLDLSIKHK